MASPSSLVMDTGRAWPPKNPYTNSTTTPNTLPGDPAMRSKWLPALGFLWKDTPGLHADLFYGRTPAGGNKDEKTPLVRYMYQALDESSKDARELTYKPFHHLYNPEGTRFVTNGGPKGLYPHHRG